MRDARHAVELDVVAPRDGREAPRHLAAQPARLGEAALEGVHGRARGGEELGDPVGPRLVGTAPFDLAQPVAHRVDQESQAARAVEQVVLQVGIAVHDPDIAEDLVEHARRAAGHALRAQLLERLPRGRPQQPDHDLPVRERGVVVRDLA